MFYLNGQINKRLGPTHVTVYKAVSDIHSIKIKTSSLLRTWSLGSRGTNRPILITNQLAFYLLNINSIILNSEIECPDPISPKSGYIEVSNFKGIILNFWMLDINEWEIFR